MWFLQVLVSAVFCFVCIRAVKSYLSPEPSLSSKDRWIVEGAGLAVYLVIGFAFLIVYGVI